MRSRILIGLIMGALGGSIGWLLQETLIHYQAVLVNGDCTAVPLTATQYSILAMCTGGIIGLFLGSVDGIVEGNAYKLRKGIITGLIAGFFIGYIGLNFGGFFYHALGGSNKAPSHASVLNFIQQMAARSCGLVFLGIAVGLGSSLASLSVPRMRNGVIGGFLGGLVGGFLFDILPLIVAPVSAAAGDVGCHDTGAVSRAVSFISIGAFTGLFIGLVQELLKDAWVKVLAGRNEGTDYILDKPVNILGRDERADVPLYGEMSVAPQHAAIRGEGGRHMLEVGSPPASASVNGQPVASGAKQLLRDGDMIQIASHRILFREKATASSFSRKPSDEPKSKSPATAVPMPSHLCPYCGAPKDVRGKCLCSVDAGLGSSTVSPPPMGISPGPGYTPSGIVGGMPSRLICLEGPYAGQGFALGGQNITVGRDDSCDVALPADPTVSRSHGRIVMEGGTFVVYDNGSSNGTFVNGMRVAAPIALAMGDLLQFGSSKFKLE